MTDRPEERELGEGQDLVGEAVAEARAEVRDEAAAEARREFWTVYWPRRVVPVVAVLALLFSVGAVWVLSGVTSRQDATDAAISVVRDNAAKAREAGDKANATLAARGQPGVPIPQPGQAADVDVIVSAATAQVLAALPNLRPTAAELGAQVARWFAANPITPPGPTPVQISAALAGYLATNPPPPGPQGERGERGETGQKGDTGDKGETGEPGHTPTSEEIQAEFAAYLRDHPDALCPKGGTFAQLSVATGDGGTADVYTCVIATYPTSTPPRTSALPIPRN
ncbi:collagen-like triple helix repeat-containing protein [Amycolatopsis tolypomycina]|uniref:collagen-like triple helix repeat-containing protein n=1 Tax=Amycolatopsis tolypomycina TaxID=208445 RepID=UPI0033B10233